MSRLLTEEERLSLKQSLSEVRDAPVPSEARKLISDGDRARRLLDRALELLRGVEGWYDPKIAALVEALPPPETWPKVGEFVAFRTDFHGDTPGQVQVAEGTIAEVTAVSEDGGRIQIKHDAGWWSPDWFRRASPEEVSGG